MQKQRNVVSRQAKLTPQEVRFIRKTWKARKATQMELASKFSVSQTAISFAVKGKTYQKVTEAA